MTQDKEQLLANRLSEFVDELIQGKTITPEQFSNQYPDMASDLKELLACIGQLQQGKNVPPLSPEESDAILRQVRNRLVHEDPSILPVNQRPDFLILLLHYAGEIWGKTKLAKLLFLLWKEGGCDKYVEDYYQPYAYNFGAFDKQMPADVEALVHRKVLKEFRPTTPQPSASDELSARSQKRVDAIYNLTPLGKEIALKLIKGAKAVDPAILDKVQMIVKKFGGMNGEDLIRYTYNKYPEFAERSFVRDEYLKNPGEGSDGTGQP